MLERDTTSATQDRSTQHIEEQTIAAFEIAFDASFELDEHATITTWSTRAEKVFGWPQAEVLGRAHPRLPVSTPAPGS